MATDATRMNSLWQIGNLKKQYEEGKISGSEANKQANIYRQQLGDMSIGTNMNSQQFADAYGLDLNPAPYTGIQQSTSANTTSTNTKKSSKKNIGSTKNNYSRDYINELYDARRQQTIADLDKSRNQSLSNLNREQSTIQPQYYDRRNQATTQNAQSARNFAEFMANRGGTNAGSNAQAEMNRNMAYQGQIGSLQRQEQSAYDDINRRRTDVNNAYESDLASANAGIEAEKLQQYIDDMRYKDSLALQEAGLTGYYNGDRTLAGQQLDYGRDSDLWNRNYQVGRDNVYDNQWQQQFDYGQTRDKVADNQWQQQFDYGQTRDKVADNQWQQQFDFTKYQTELDNAYRQQQLEQDAKQFAEQMGYNWANLSQRDKEYMMSLAEQQRQYDTNLSQRQTEFNYEQSQQQSADLNKQVNTYQSQIDSMKSIYAPSENILTYIQNLENSGVSEEVINQLLIQNGFPTGR